MPAQTRLSFLQIICISVVFLFLLVSRFIWLDKFPVGMYHDEVEYLLSAKSYMLTGADLSGYGLPLSLVKTETDGIISPVPPVITAVYAFVTPLTHQSSRIPVIIVNILTMLLIFFITSRFSGNKKIGFIASVVFLLNPWSIYLSRFAVDSPFALLFFLLGIYILLSSSGNKIFYSLVFFILGFFSYHGAKVTFLPLIGVLIISKLAEGSEKFKPSKAFAYFICAASFVFIFATVASIIPNSIINTRSDDLIFSRQDDIARLVDEGRRLSIESPVNPIFVNKIKSVSEIFIDKYLTSFSPDVLFLKGDARATYRFGSHGLFYFIDFLFICLGFVYLYKKSFKHFFLMVALILIAPIPSAISAVDTSTVNRAFLLLPLLTILIAYGIWGFINLVSKSHFKKIAVFSICLVYLLSFLNFLHFYFYRYPINQQESYFLSERILSRFISFNTNKKTEVILPDERISRSVFLEYLFYSGQEDHNFKTALSNIKNGQFELENTIFTSKCPEVGDPDTIYIISKDVNSCWVDGTLSYQIIDQKDAGSIYKVYNSSSCEGVTLNRFRRLNNSDDYAIEDLDKDKFCERWINTP